MSKTDPRQLITTWQNPIYDFVLRRLRNEADAADVTQEALLSLLKDYHTVSSPEKVRAWVYRLALNAVMNHRRGERRRQNRLDQVESRGPSEATADVIARQQHHEWLKGQVRALPEELQEVIVLRYFHGLTQVEIAEVLDLPRGTVRSRVDRGLQRLRQSLSQTQAPALGLGLEEALSQLGPEPIPPHWQSQLKQIIQSPASPAAAPITGSLIVGGALMKWKIALAASVFFVIGLASDRAMQAISQIQTPPVAKHTKPTPQQTAAKRTLKAQVRKLEALKSELEQREKNLKQQLTQENQRVERLEQQLKQAQAAQAASIKAGKGSKPNKGPEVAGKDERSKVKQLIDEIIDMGLSPTGHVRDEDFAKHAHRLEEIQRTFNKMAHDDTEAVGHAIMEIFKDSNDGKVRKFALLLFRRVALELGRSPFYPKLHKEILEYLKTSNDSDDERALVLQAMQINGAPKSSFDWLLGVAQGGSELMRVASLPKLARSTDPVARRLVLAALRDDNESDSLRYAIMNDLNVSDAAGAAVLPEFIHSPNRGLRSSALYKAGEAPKSRALKLSLELYLTKNPKAHNATMAISALIHHGDENSLRLLEQLKKDQGLALETRSTASQAIRSLKARLAKDKN